MKYQEYRTYEKFKDAFFDDDFRLKYNSLTIKVDDGVSYTLIQFKSDGNPSLFLENDIRKHWEVYNNYFEEKYYLRSPCC